MTVLESLAMLGSVAMLRSLATLGSVAMLESVAMMLSVAETYRSLSVPMAKTDLIHANLWHC